MMPERAGWPGPGGTHTAPRAPSPLYSPEGPPPDLHPSFAPSSPSQRLQHWVPRASAHTGHRLLCMPGSPGSLTPGHRCRPPPPAGLPELTCCTGRCLAAK